MKKQKICIVGGGLTGLVTAIGLSKLNCEIDLFSESFNQNLESIRTIAVSENNFEFLNQLNFSKLLKKQAWVCSKLKLYTENESEKFSEIFELDNENKKENIFYMLENSKILKIMMNEVKKSKSISLKNNKKVLSVYNSGLLKCVKLQSGILKYNLVIICSGANSNLVKNIFDSKIIKNSYKEFAVTTTLSHKSLKNNIARQIFLDNAILAMLPISKNKTSIVLSLKNSMKEKNDSFLKNKIKIYVSKYLEEIKLYNKIEKKDLNLLIRNKYYSDRILLFGDALHIMHPFVGQSFNITLRNLKILKKILKDKLSLGLDIGGDDVLSEFSDEAKPNNFSFIIGSDILKNALSFKKPRNDLFKILNKNNLLKNVVFDVANKGFRF